MVRVRPMSAQDTTPDGPLSWLRVVDLTDLRGALCARILADFGADVIRVERERSARLARARVPQREQARRGARPRDDRRAGSTSSSPTPTCWSRTSASTPVAERHPHLVHVALTDLGLSGPRSGWHLEPLPALAASGALWASGFPQLPPCNGPGDLAHDCASVYGAIGAVAAVLDRARHDDDRGQVVEVSAQEAGLAGLIPWSVAMQDYLSVNPLLPADGKRNADGAYWVLPAADGWVRIVVGSPKQWAGFKSLMRDAEVFEADEWRNPQFRLMNADVIRMVAQERLTDRTRAELFEEGRGNGATVGVLHQPSEFVAHPADPPPRVLRRRRRRPRRAPVRHATGEAGAHAVVDPARGVGARTDPTFAADDARAVPRSAVAATSCSTACAWSSSASPRWCPRCARCSRSSAPT